MILRFFPSLHSVLYFFAVIILMVAALPGFSAEYSSNPSFSLENDKSVMNVDRSGKEFIKEGQILNISQALEIGLKKNPVRTAALNNIEISKSRVGQARSNYYPQISLFSSYDRISLPLGISNFSSTQRQSTSLSAATAPERQIGGLQSGATGSSTKQQFNSYSAGISVSQNIFDFWRTSAAVDVAKFNLESSKWDLDTSTDQISLNIKSAYYSVLQAEWTRKVAAEVVKQMNLHLEQAQAFYQAGTHPKIDVTKANLDLSNARLNMIVADNNLKIAWVNLNNSMGIPDAPAYTIEDNLAFKKYSITPEIAINDAFRNRPELKSIIAQEKAAEKILFAARRDFGPTISGSILYEYSGTDFPLESGWVLGIGASLPVFSGFLTTYQIKEAKYTFRVLKANEEYIRQQILLEIRQAFVNLAQSEQSFETAQLAVKQAEENLDLARNRFSTGVGNPVEISDAFASYVNTQTSYINSLYNYKIAQAVIEKATGKR